MLPILEELKTTMDKYNLTPGDVSNYIGCSPKTVYNWLIYQTSGPSVLFQRQIRKAIRRIEREFSKDNIGLEINKLYRAVWPKLNLKEKNEILELLNEAGPDFQRRYLEKLKALALIHHVKIEGGPEGPGGSDV